MWDRLVSGTAMPAALSNVAGQVPEADRRDSTPIAVHALRYIPACLLVSFLACVLFFLPPTTPIGAPRDFAERPPRRLRPPDGLQCAIMSHCLTGIHSTTTANVVYSSERVYRPPSQG